MRMFSGIFPSEDIFIISLLSAARGAAEPPSRTPVYYEFIHSGRGSIFSGYFSSLIELLYPVFIF